MSFLDWMNMNMAFDIAFVVFAAAAVWKFSKMKKQIEKLNIKQNELETNIAYHKAYSQELANRIDLQTKSIVELSNDVEITMRNPAEARRLFKQRQKQDNITQDVNNDSSN